MAVQGQVKAAAEVRGQAAIRKERNERPTTRGTIARYIGVVIVVLICIAPFYWTVAVSLKGGLELNFSPPTLYPHNFTLENYNTDLTSPDGIFTKDLLNSAIVAGCTTILCLLFGSLCAYAIARMRFRGKALVLAAVLSVSMFPVIALVGPLYVLFTNLGLYNTYLALIIPNLVLTLPLTIWFLTSFFRDLPKDLEEAALVDGDTHLGALWHVILPLAAPGVFTTAILSFISAWNEFLFGLTMTSDQAAQPVTVGITLFNGEHTIPWGEIAAAAVIVTVPLVILVLIFQRRIVSGLTAGAVKG
jgi:multiple sugar transport system permease protein